MSPASHGAHMSQIGRTVALLRSHASFGDLVALMKPRVMSLVVFTALVGLLVAPGRLDPLIGFVALLCITGRRRRGRAQHVVRCRFDGPHSYAPDSARPCIARGSAHVRAKAVPGLFESVGFPAGSE
jgi:hypothetical protein